MPAMKIGFTVQGVPPKKHGANSMWRNPADVPRLMALRAAAHKQLGGKKAPAEKVRLVVRVFAEVAAGDLDNFIAGVCDGLMAAQSNTPIDALAWSEVPEAVHPRNAIAYDDDSCFSKIVAERLTATEEGPRYEVELSW